MELVDAETNVELAQFPALKHTGFLHEASPDEYARRWEEFVEGNMARYFFRLFWGTSVSRRLIDGPLGPERALRLFGDIHMESEY